MRSCTSFTLLQRYAVFEDGEFGIAVGLGGGLFLAGAYVYDVGDEALEQFGHGCAIQQDTGIEVYPLGLATGQIAIGADLQRGYKGGEGGSPSGGEEYQLTAGSSQGGAGNEVVAGGGEEE